MFGLPTAESILKWLFASLILSRISLSDPENRNQTRGATDGYKLMGYEGLGNLREFSKNSTLQ